MSQEEKVHLRDFVWMRSPEGGDPVEVSTAGDEISKHMAAGWSQVFPEKGEGE